MILLSFSRCVGLSKLLRSSNCVSWTKKAQLHKRVDFSFSGSLLAQQMNEIYSQRAYTPSQMSNILIQQMSSQSQQNKKQMILHQLSLYHSKVLTFDYDYFCQSLKRLIQYQDSLKIEDIFMLYDLTIEYKIDSLIVKTHFQNELYCRLYSSIKKQLLDYDKSLQNQQNQLYKRLQSKSDDHFGIVSDKMKSALAQKLKQQIQQEQQQEDDKNEYQSKSNNQLTEQQIFQSCQQQIAILNKPIYNSAQRKSRSKNISQQKLNKISAVFIQTGSKNIQLNKLLLQVYTVRLDEHSHSEKLAQLSPNFLLLYSKLTVNLLQLYMSQFHSVEKAKQYTHRSVKNIYKVQAFYYYEIAKMIEQKRLLSQATNEQLNAFVQVLSSFPIRRRSFRKSIGLVLIEEFLKRQFLPQNLSKFFQLSRFDNKLLQSFENQINKNRQLSTSTPLIMSVKQLENQLALIPQIVNQNAVQTGLFKMPLELFRKKSKKKSKSKNKRPKQEQIQIDLTQAEDSPSNKIESSSDNIEGSSKTKLNEATRSPLTH